MITIALIGLDGVGKTTISRRVMRELPYPVTYIYMGVNPGSSNHMLPTTRLVAALKHGKGKKEWEGPPDPNRLGERPTGLRKQVTAGLRGGLRLANRLAEEWYRQGLTWYALLRGRMVLYDRHFFFDYFSTDIAPTQAYRPLARKIHGYFLEHVYPRPDLVILLDAPAEVVFARKGEGTIESLERRRQEYFQMEKYVNCFSVVDATQPEEAVLDEVLQIIRGYAGQLQATRKVGHVQR